MKIKNECMLLYISRRGTQYNVITKFCDFSALFAKKCKSDNFVFLAALKQEPKSDKRLTTGANAFLSGGVLIISTSIVRKLSRTERIVLHTNHHVFYRQIIILWNQTK